jgi:CRP-like cAMP-binding protein
MSISADQIESLMEGHVFFGGVTPDERTALVEMAEIHEAESDTILFHHGERCRGFYLLLDGTVQIYRMSPEGRMLVLHVIRPGESFAEVPLFEEQDDATYPATAEPLSDSTLLFFPGDRFLAFLDDHPDTALRMLGQMAGRLREAVHQLDAVSLRDVQERLARHLVEQVPMTPDEPDAPPTVELDIPKSVLAAELGTIPETLSRALRQLEEQDLIRSHPSEIALTDVRGLRQLGHDN